MKLQSLQTKFLIIVITAVLVVALLVGWVSISETIEYIHTSSAEHISTSCQKEAAEINGIFGNMENSVHIMSSYVLDFLINKQELPDLELQNKITIHSEKMFSDIANNTGGAIAYYLRFDPYITGENVGLFHSKTRESEDFLEFELTDISLYERKNVERVGWFWIPYEAGRPVWIPPYYNENSGLPMISYVIPMYMGNSFLGVVGMDFDYTALAQKVSDISIYENGFAYLEDDGKIVYHNELDAGTPVPDISEEYMQASYELNNGMTLVLSASYDDIRLTVYSITTKIVLVVLVLVVSFSLMVILIVRKIVSPLEMLTESAKKLSDGNYDIEITHTGTREIELLSSTFETMALRLREHSKYQHLLAYRDSLTGLRNTTSYNAWVKDFNEEISEEPSDFGVVVLDINYLKETNDRYGHDVGNKLITTATRLISGVFKRSPVFRIGGDEFAVILQNNDFAERDRLVERLEQEFTVAFIMADDTKIPVSVAKGVAVFDGGRDKCFADVFNRADDNMYENKRKMKNQI